MFALALRYVLSTFLKVALHEQWRGSRARSPCYSVSFVSFSLRLFSQRKAAKNFWYQRSFNAFSFEVKGPKEKALQKENAVMRSRRKPPKLISFTSGNPYAARAVAFEKAPQNFFCAWFVQTRCEINQNLNSTQIFIQFIEHTRHLCASNTRIWRDRSRNAI